MRANRGRDTAPELAVRRELHRRGLRYRVNFRPLSQWRRTVDIAFPRHRLAVLIDGCFWHGCPDHHRPSVRNAAFWDAKVRTTAARDQQTTTLLEQQGWTVLRFWEHEDPVRIADAVQVAVNGGPSDGGGLAPDS